MDSKNITTRTPAEQEAINALHGIARGFCTPTLIASVPRSMQEHALREAIRMALDRLQDIAADEGIDSPGTINYLLKALDGGR